MERDNLLISVWLMHNNHCYIGSSLIPDINEIVEEILKE